MIGLKIVFNIEQSEYIADLTQTAGVRVLIHDQKRSPFPEEEGIDISPGYATSVGITMVCLYCCVIDIPLSYASSVGITMVC